MKTILLSGLLLFISVFALAQDKFFTKNGRISFVSKGNMETIAARHKGVTAVLDSKSGAIQFSVLMKGFEFEKALMQEHFNENYVESDKYPKASFAGTISNNGDIKYTTDGAYNATVKGKLTLHGVTKDIEASGKVIVKDGKPQLSSSLVILLSDYQIKIPAVSKDNISNTVTITIDCLLEPLQK